VCRNDTRIMSHARNANIAPALKRMSVATGDEIADICHSSFCDWRTVQLRGKTIKKF
jgi:hypothetical protein